MYLRPLRMLSLLSIFLVSIGAVGCPLFWGHPYGERREGHERREERHEEEEHGERH